MAYMITSTLPLDSNVGAKTGGGLMWVDTLNEDICGKEVCGRQEVQCRRVQCPGCTTLMTSRAAACKMSQRIGIRTYDYFELDCSTDC